MPADSPANDNVLEEVFPARKQKSRDGSLRSAKSFLSSSRRVLPLAGLADPFWASPQSRTARASTPPVSTLKVTAPKAS